MSLSSFVRPAKEKVPVSATPLAPSVGGPDRPSLDSLQSKADGSAQVSGLRKLSEAAPQAAPAQAQDSDQAAVRQEASGSGVEPVKSRVEDAGASAFHEKTVSSVAGLASSANQG